ncbi:DUF605-domain-containing protein [Backusella circina FSU 941]|nr:DUF605-domain-containing protein [Backusella circina FSU 941]
MDIPAELKFISPFIQRGQELTTRDPVTSYYAYYYAVTLALGKGQKNEEAKMYLSHILDELEKQKRSLEGNEAITDDLVGYAHVENFALKIFINADNEDRAGKASKKTAKTFLAASVFLEILKTFGEIDPEVEGKIKYAKFKAADIMKALREGRTPTPGPPGEEQPPTAEADHDDIITTPPPISEFPSPPSNFTAPLSPSGQQDHSISTADVAQPHFVTQTPPPPPPPATPPPQIQSQDINITAAQKNAKWAISALEYDDIATARTQLLSALNNIGFNQTNNFGF